MRQSQATTDRVKLRLRHYRVKLPLRHGPTSPTHTSRHKAALPNPNSNTCQECQTHINLFLFFHTMDFPANLCIRPLTINDLCQVEELETALYPKEQRASTEKLQYRLTVAPELCTGLFLREYIPEFNQVNLPEIAERINREHHYHVRHTAIQPDEPGKSSVVRETLVGHVLATKIRGSKITTSSTELPIEGNPGTGHHEWSRTIGVHSVCISPEWKGKNLDTLMLHDYIQKLSNQDLGDQIALVCDLDMVGFYAKIGFARAGDSECVKGAVDMTINLVPEDI